MKALTLWQPWATLVAIGEKAIETRSWMQIVEAPLAIHAAKTLPAEAADFARREPATRLLADRELPLGAIVAVALKVTPPFRFDARTLIAIRRRSAAGELPPYEAELGDFSNGRVGYPLRHVLPIRRPIPCLGARGFWDVPPDVERSLRAEIVRALGEKPDPASVFGEDPHA